MPFILVSIAVLINIVGAIILKTAADRGVASLVFLSLILVLTAGLNGIRFVLWGYTHKRFPLSTSYPITSMFFPFMLAVSYCYGDPIHLRQLLGTFLITVGVFWLTYKSTRLSAVDAADEKRPAIWNN